MFFIALFGMVFAVDAPAKEFLVYFGTYTNALSRGIYVSRLDADTGKLSEPVLAAEVSSPCFIALSPDEKHLYSANSVKISSAGNSGTLSAFSINRDSGRLSLLNETLSGGVGPCHVSVDASGKVLFAANYGSGSIKSIRLESDGSLGADGSIIQNVGHGVNTNRQSSPHAHFICADPSDRFVLACDLGLDQVQVYSLNPSDATMVPEMQLAGHVPPGSGARHLAFGRDRKYAYVINEMAGTISIFAWDVKTGSLTLRETVSALPPDVAVQASFTAAEILVHPSGKFVYATIRGHDSVSVLAVSPRDGRLKFVQNIPSGGKAPRGLGIDPTGRWLITGNQKTDNAVAFAIDAETGKLTPTGQELRIGAPVDVKFVK